MLISGPRIDWWRVSVAAWAQTNVMDVVSSWGKWEMNPALANSRGTFGTRGMLLKAGVTGGVLGLEYVLLRRTPSVRLRKVLMLLNFGAAGATGAIAVRNWGIPRP